MIEAKYLSGPTRSSTSHKSQMEYPHSGTSSTSVGTFPYLPALTLHQQEPQWCSPKHPSAPRELPSYCASLDWRPQQSMMEPPIRCLSHY
ncbi:hypothetical protein B296_00032132 [Ensete ventricosum]|uniref:Uncharacterized protein n=1 Tax=Ensete ventricosum TaxID=4639 RepID=A0A427A9Z9_ENSVE|nr:hypothetical protein B296_00032132 [Ensete ventricosum]